MIGFCEEKSRISRADLDENVSSAPALGPAWLTVTRSGFPPPPPGSTALGFKVIAYNESASTGTGHFWNSFVNSTMTMVQ